MEPYARAVFGPFATTLATAVLPATALVLFDPRTAHFGVGDTVAEDQPRATAFNSYTSRAQVPRYNGDYTLVPEEFLLHKWYNELRLQELKPKVHRNSTSHSIFERMHDTFNDAPTRDDLERQEAFLSLAVTYKITRTLKLDTPKDASTFAKKQHRRFAHIRKEAKKRFTADLKDADIIHAYTKLREKRERLEAQEEENAHHRKKRKRAHNGTRQRGEEEEPKGKKQRLVDKKV
jgi:hypothetical protein